MDRGFIVKTSLNTQKRDLDVNGLLYTSQQDSDDVLNMTTVKELHFRREPTFADTAVSHNRKDVN